MSSEERKNEFSDISLVFLFLINKKISQVWTRKSAWCVVFFIYKQEYQPDMWFMFCRCFLLPNWLQNINQLVSFHPNKIITQWLRYGKWNCTFWRASAGSGTECLDHWNFLDNFQIGRLDTIVESVSALASAFSVLSKIQGKNNGQASWG